MSRYEDSQWLELQLRMERAEARVKKLEAEAVELKAGVVGMSKYLSYRTPDLVRHVICLEGQAAEFHCLEVPATERIVSFLPLECPVCCAERAEQIVQEVVEDISWADTLSRRSIEILVAKLKRVLRGEDGEK